MAQPGKHLEFHTSPSSTHGTPAGEPSLVAREPYLSDATSALSPNTFETTEADLNNRLILATTPFARATIECHLCTLYSAIGKNDQAIAVGLTGLADLGVYYGSAKPTFIRALYVAMQRQKKMRTLAVDHVTSLPTMQDPLASLTMQLLTTAIYPSMIVRPHLAMLLVNKQISIILNHGNSECSPAAFLYLAIESSKILNRLSPQSIHTTTIHKLLDIYLALSKSWPQASHSLRTHFDFLQFARQWQPDCAPDARESMAIVSKFIEQGDGVYASVAAIESLNHSFSSGHNITELISASDHWSKMGTGTFPANQLKVIERTRSSLLEFQTKDILEIRFNRRANPTDFALGETPQNETTLNQELKVQESIYQGLALTLLGEFASANQSLALALDLSHSRRSTSDSKIPLSNLFMAITMVHLYPSAPGIKRMAMRRLMQKIRRKFMFYNKTAHTYPTHEIIFIDALWDVMREKSLLTVYQKLDEALAQATHQSYISDVASIGEFFGRFLLLKNEPTMAAPVILKARDAYERWGLKAKVREMNEIYEYLSFAEFNG